MRALYAVIATTPERTAQNAIRFLFDDDVAHLRGHAFYDPTRYEGSPIAYDRSLVEKAWSATTALLIRQFDEAIPSVRESSLRASF